MDTDIDAGGSAIALPGFRAVEPKTNHSAESHLGLLKSVCQYRNSG